MRTFLHFARVMLRMDAPWSQVTAAELQLLREHCAGARLVVEIGCYEGKTTVELAEVTVGSVYTIDPFFRGRLGICWSELVARMHCRRRAASNVKFVRALSQDAAGLVPDKIDFLFIDGDHSDLGIQRDWAIWFPKVRRGGVIALHDCLVAPSSPVELGSTRFYRSTLLRMSNIRLIGVEGSLAVFEKSAG